MKATPTASEQANRRQKEKQPDTVGWAEVRRRLEFAQAAIERGWAPTADENKAVFRARAAALAREPEKEETPSESLEVVEFLLAH